jgi:hypothetical protein
VLSPAIGMRGECRYGLFRTPSLYSGWLLVIGEDTCSDRIYPWGMRSESKVDLDALIADSLAVVREAPSRAGRIVALETMGVKHVFFLDTRRVTDIYRASAPRCP